MKLGNSIGIVTGAARDSGRAIAPGLARERANVAGADIDFEEGNSVAPGPTATMVMGALASNAFLKLTGLGRQA